LTGTFVEPQSNYYRELQKTYRGFQAWFSSNARLLPPTAQ